MPMVTISGTSDSGVINGSGGAGEGGGIVLSLPDVTVKAPSVVLEATIPRDTLASMSQASHTTFSQGGGSAGVNGGTEENPAVVKLRASLQVNSNTKSSCLALIYDNFEVYTV